jgi:hypothetical protein
VAVLGALLCVGAACVALIRGPVSTNKAKLATTELA